MKSGSLLVRGSGGHSNADTARCPSCREPVRFHNAGGSVRAESECTLPFGGADVPAPPTGPAPVEPAPPSAAAADDQAAVETPRRPEPRPAGDALVAPAAVGEDDADEEVAVVVPSTRAAATPGLLDRIGARVAQRRHEAGLSVEKLARAAGIAEGHLGHIEGGRRNITLGVLEAVARVLRCDVADLVAPEPPAVSRPAGPAAAGAATPAAALDDLAALVGRVLDRAYFYAARWYCGGCISWPSNPGVCPVCRGPLQPVYLATLPREVSE